RLGAQLGLTAPDVPVRHVELKPFAQNLGKRLREFGLAVQGALMQHKEDIVDRQYVLERISDAACELYVSGCTLSRLEHLLGEGNGNLAELRRDVLAGQHFLRLADRRVRQSLAALKDNDDASTTATADAVLERY